MFDAFRYKADSASVPAPKPLKREFKKEKPSKDPEEEFIGESSRFRDRWKSTCNPCFLESVKCPHFEEKQLQLLLVGHNPSAHAWATGFSYSNPSNRMWKVLQEAKIIPRFSEISFQNVMGSKIGVGMADVGTLPDSESVNYDANTMLQWRGMFYARCRGHMKRVRQSFVKSSKKRAKRDETAAGAGVLAPSSICVISDSDSDTDIVHEDGRIDDIDVAPKVIAFTGKRQFQYLFQPPLGKLEAGLTDRRPPGWPFPPHVPVWVLDSTSGRNVIPKDKIVEEYASLAASLPGLDTFGLDDWSEGKE